MKKFILIALILVFAFSACSGFGLNAETPVDAAENQIQASGNKFQVVDALEREIQFNTLPTKIVVAGRQTPMLVNFFYLFDTAQDKVQAIERRGQSADDFLFQIDPGIKEKYLLERDAGIEQIAPLNPDVVILKTTMRESIGRGIEEVGIPVVYIEFETVDQIYRDLAVFAALLGEEDRGNELINRYKQYKSEIDTKINQTSSKPKVVLAQIEEKENGVTYNVPPSAWLQSTMVLELGANPVWVDEIQGSGWAEVNIEQIINWNPDYLFVINYQGNGISIVDKIKFEPLWQNTVAGNLNQFYAFGYDFLSWDQPDPRWILGYSWMASKLYPDQITSETAYSIVQDFYKVFYSLDEKTFAEFIAPRIENYFE